MARIGRYGAAVDLSGYQPKSEKDQANGYPGLDATGKIADSAIPDGIARDSETSTAVAVETTARAAADAAEATARAAADGLLVPKSLYSAKGSLLGATAAGTPVDIPATTDGYGLVLDSSLAAGFGWKPRSRVSASDHTGSGVLSGSGEKTMFTLAVPITVAQDDEIHFGASGDSLQNSGGSVNLTARLKLGATTIVNSAAQAFASLGTAAGRRQWSIDGAIHVMGAAAQRAIATLIVAGASQGTTGWATAGASGIAGGTATEDLTAGKNLVFTLEWASATNTELVCQEAWLEVVKKA